MFFSENRILSKVFQNTLFIMIVLHGDDIHQKVYLIQLKIVFCTKNKAHQAGHVCIYLSSTLRFVANFHYFSTL